MVMRDGDLQAAISCEGSGASDCIRSIVACESVKTVKFLPNNYRDPKLCIRIIEDISPFSSKRTTTVPPGYGGDPSDRLNRFKGALTQNFSFPFSTMVCFGGYEPPTRRSWIPFIKPSKGFGCCTRLRARSSVPIAPLSYPRGAP